jgi:hypothetical protein
LIIAGFEDILDVVNDFVVVVRDGFVVGFQDVFDVVSDEVKRESFEEFHWTISC